MIRFDEAEERSLSTGDPLMVDGEVIGIPVRFICTADMGWVIPVPDVSKAIGLTRQQQSDILRNNKEQFEPFMCVRGLPTGLTSSIVSHKCLTRDGLIMFLMKLNAQSMKNKEIASRISEFQIYVIKTFGEHLDYYKVPQWWARREATKLKYKGMTDAIKDHLLYDVPDEKKWLVFATEADMLNVVVFGKTAKEAGCNQRDKASQSQLDLLEKLEENNEGFIRLNFGIQIRYEMLCKIRDDLITRGRSLAEVPKKTPDYTLYIVY